MPQSDFVNFSFELFRIETDDMSAEEPRQQPFCQLFKGSVCSTHIGNKSIYVTSRYAQGLREEKVIGMC